MLAEVLMTASRMSECSPNWSQTPEHVIILIFEFLTPTTAPEESMSAVFLSPRFAQKALTPAGSKSVLRVGQPEPTQPGFEVVLDFWPGRQWKAKNHNMHPGGCTDGIAQAYQEQACLNHITAVAVWNWFVKLIGWRNQLARMTTVNQKIRRRYKNSRATMADSWFQFILIVTLIFMRAPPTPRTSVILNANPNVLYWNENLIRWNLFEIDVFWLTSRRSMEKRWCLFAPTMWRSMRWKTIMRNPSWHFTLTAISNDRHRHILRFPILTSLVTRT